MFSLYINIDHLKLLNKSNSKEIRELFLSINKKISLGGGIKKGDYETCFSFPSNYQYSKVNFLNCLKELHFLLSNSSELVGFSLIVDYGMTSSEIDQFNLLSSFHLKSDKLNSIWLTEDSYSVLNRLIYGDKKNGLILLPESFYTMVLPSFKIDEKIIMHNVQDSFNSSKSSILYIDGTLTASLFKNIEYWGEKEGYDTSLVFDLKPGGDRLLTFIKYLVTFNDLFNPIYDLDSYETDQWGDYLTLYRNICIECNDYFVLDDSNVHFNKLILLWFEAFTKRFKTKLLVNSDSVKELDQLWEILALIDNLKIFVVGKSLKKRDDLLKFSELPSLNMCLSETLYSFLNKIENKSLMVLYITILTKGLLQYRDILKAMADLGFNILELKEELDYFKRKGLLIGNSFLYPTSDRILYVIKEIKGDTVTDWKDNFLKSLFSFNLKSSFLYNYIYCLISLGTDYHDLGLKALFDYIEKELDLGKKVVLSEEIVKLKNRDSSLCNIIEYKDKRECRILDNKIIDIDKSSYDFDDEYQVALLFIDVLNRWSRNNSDGLVKSCKDLFYIYQSKGEHLCETRVKIIFALSLLGVGQVNEAVDYLELNTSYSLSIKDTLSYIRSGCFLAVAQYIKGNFSGVLRVSDGLLENNWIKLKSKWYIYIMFVRYRALLEICRYDEALTLIDKAIVIAKDCGYTDSLTLLNNWKGRGLYYSGHEGRAREVLLGNNLTNETYYFLSEIEFFSGNYEKAITYIRKAQVKYDTIELFDENISWRDGYYLVEEFFDRDNRSSVLKCEVESFYYMLLLYTDHKEDGISGLKSIISKISNDSIGVHDYKYLYFLYSGSENIGFELDFNRDNILNKVFKLLQKRTSNMDAHSQKHLYLNNFLNGRIIEKARVNKLF